MLISMLSMRGAALFAAAFAGDRREGTSCPSRGMSVTSRSALGNGLSRAARYHEDGDGRQHGVQGHHAEERAIAVDHIEHSSVEGVAERAAERHREQVQ